LSIKLDPWGYADISDYTKLFEQFGIEPVDRILDLIPVKHHFFTRKVVFGHRDMDKWIEALKKGEKVAVLTGFMPSGPVHLGHAMVFEELRYLQSIGAKIIVAIADAEAYAVRRVDRDKTIEYGLEYIANSIAWGLDPEKTTFYFQTNQKKEYYRLVQLFSRKITLAEMEAIYGELSPAKIMASLTQAADILHPQLSEYGGYKHVIVPVGADQDPHIRLARDLADRFENELGLKRPAAMYHKFVTGLDGNKMSSSRPEYAIFLKDDLDVVRKKIAMALTGGRATAEEQRRLGGEPNKCSIYQLYTYFVRDDKEVLDVYENCISGRILCGECKRIFSEKMIEFLKEHQKKIREIMESGLLKQIVSVPEF